MPRHTETTPLLVITQAEKFAVMIELGILRGEKSRVSATRLLNSKGRDCMVTHSVVSPSLRTFVMLLISPLPINDIVPEDRTVAQPKLAHLLPFPPRPKTKRFSTASARFLNVRIVRPAVERVLGSLVASRAPRPRALPASGGLHLLSLSLFSRQSRLQCVHSC